MNQVIDTDMFTLKIWLTENERSASWLGRKCDVSSVTAHYWITGKYYPTKKNLKKINEITGLNL